MRQSLYKYAGGHRTGANLLRRVFGLGGSADTPHTPKRRLTGGGGDVPRTPTHIKYKVSPELQDFFAGKSDALSKAGVEEFKQLLKQETKQDYTIILGDHRKVVAVVRQEDYNYATERGLKLGDIVSIARKSGNADNFDTAFRENVDAVVKSRKSAPDAQVSPDASQASKNPDESTVIKPKEETSTPTDKSPDTGAESDLMPTDVQSPEQLKVPSNKRAEALKQVTRFTNENGVVVREKLPQGVSPEAVRSLQAKLSNPSKQLTEADVALLNKLTAPDGVAYIPGSNGALFQIPREKWEASVSGEAPWSDVTKPLHRVEVTQSELEQPPSLGDYVPPKTVIPIRPVGLEPNYMDVLSATDLTRLQRAMVGNRLSDLQTVRSHLAKNNFKDLLPKNQGLVPIDTDSLPSVWSQDPRWQWMFKTPGEGLGTKLKDPTIRYLNTLDSATRRVPILRKNISQAEMLQRFEQARDIVNNARSNGRGLTADEMQILRAVYADYSGVPLNKLDNVFYAVDSTGNIKPYVGANKFTHLADDANPLATIQLVSPEKKLIDQYAVQKAVAALERGESYDDVVRQFGAAPTNDALTWANARSVDLAIPDVKVLESFTPEGLRNAAKYYESIDPNSPWVSKFNNLADNLQFNKDTYKGDSAAYSRIFSHIGENPDEYFKAYKRARKESLDAAKVKYKADGSAEFDIKVPETPKDKPWRYRFDSQTFADRWQSRQFGNWKRISATLAGGGMLGLGVANMLGNKLDDSGITQDLENLGRPATPYKTPSESDPNVTPWDKHEEDAQAFADDSYYTDKQDPYAGWWSLGGTLGGALLTPALVTALLPKKSRGGLLDTLLTLGAVGAGAYGGYKLGDWASKQKWG